MRFDDEAIKAAARRLCFEHGFNPDDPPGLWRRYKKAARFILNDALASMKSHDVDPCEEARKEERVRCVKAVKKSLYSRSCTCSFAAENAINALEDGK